MRKFLTGALLAVLTIGSLTACGNRNNNGDNNTTNPIQEIVTDAVDGVSEAASDIGNGISEAATGAGDILDGSMAGTDAHNNESKSAGGAADDGRGLDEMMSDASYHAPNN